ncbi:thiazole synthase [Clostridium perfringens NCTC 8239]|nr:thiazole synthase [Clostridium perfringens NCTC 8239]
MSRKGEFFMDKLIIGGVEIKNRLFVGSGKYPSNEIIKDVLEGSGSQVITLALRRVDLDNKEEDILQNIPKDVILLPNTSGATNAEEAIRIARIARAMGCGNWIKIEVISDSKYLLPDNEETIKATKVLADEGFIVLPYMCPDLYAGRRLIEAGAAAVMPLGAPIGSNRGLKTKELIQIMIDELDIPIIVDAGIGKPSQAMEAMEMGAAACLVNTAIASSEDPINMARAFKMAVEGGRLAYEAKMGRESKFGNASSPLTGFLD